MEQGKLGIENSDRVNYALDAFGITYSAKPLRERRDGDSDFIIYAAAWPHKWWLVLDTPVVHVGEDRYHLTAPDGTECVVGAFPGCGAYVQVS